MPITLTVTQGPHAGRRFTFDGHDAFLVGRSKHAHFRLPRHDMYFSRIHILVEVNPPHCCLLDMGSTNGTVVNGRRVKPGQAVPLSDGDRVEGGDTVLHVSITPESAAPAEEPAPPHRAAPVPRPLPAGPSPAHPACVACGAASEAGQTLCPACARAAQAQPQPFGDYQLIRELGRGAMGIVHLAVHRPNRTRVALKVVTPAVAASPEQMRRFLREADILREIHHPHIIGFFDMGEAAAQLYLAMDYVEGVDAETLLRRRGPMLMAPAVRLVCQLLEALEYAHGRGFVHRDIKPANLLIETVQGRSSVRLADFGLARVYAASQMSGLTIAGDVGGTVAFMPPEQITHFREARPPADLYSTAATLYYLITGQFVHDFPPAMHERLERILTADAVPIRRRKADVPRRLADAIHRALARDPEERFASAEAMRRALVPFAS